MLNLEWRSKSAEVTLTSRLYGLQKHDNDGGADQNWAWTVYQWDTQCTSFTDAAPEPTRHVKITLRMFNIEFELLVCVALRAGEMAEGYGDLDS